MEPKSETIVLGGGCFWCLDAVYQTFDGVLSVVSGYAGGEMIDPDYKSVCSGQTGHTEVVRIEFDPAVIPLSGILEKFWQFHDPTTLNRQGNDVGTQYRSAIYFANEEQKRVVEQSVEEAQKHFSREIVTEVAPLDIFYPAEGYHQNYFNENPAAPYCQFVIRPKVEKALQG